MLFYKIEINTNLIQLQTILLIYRNLTCCYGDRIIFKGMYLR